MSKIIVRSVEEYLREIKQHKLPDCISRGESAKYGSIQSGLFREDFFPKDIIRRYYNLVGNSLTKMQEEHFAAFSQHYGLPTNLIDFTDSPLISLFFACQNENESESGYVHFIRKGKLIDISNNASCINRLNYFEQILSFSIDAIDITVEFVRKVLSICCYEDYEGVDSLRDVISHHINLAREAGSDFNGIIDFNQIDYEVPYNELAKQFQEQCPEILNESQCFFLDRVYEIVCDESGTVADCILYFLIILKVVHTAFAVSPVWDMVKWFDLPFYFSYRPPLIVKRIENQSSIFIQQQYLSLERFPHNVCNNPVIQRIKPDLTFEITNKEQIFAELDALGINERFIYNDYDSIARYLKRKIYAQFDVSI